MSKCSACGKTQEPRKGGGEIKFTIEQEWSLWVTSPDDRPDLRVCLPCMYEFTAALCAQRKAALDTSSDTPPAGESVPE